MMFDPNNQVVKLCSTGMQLEGEGKPTEAALHYMQAWELAADSKDRSIAAHYVARQQPTIADKLHWDEKALQLALSANGEEIRATCPSLYLNVGKCHEDMGNYNEARQHYELAEQYCTYLTDDGYSKMIRTGIKHAQQRIAGLSGTD